MRIITISDFSKRSKNKEGLEPYGLHFWMGHLANLKESKRQYKETDECGLSSHTECYYRRKNKTVNYEDKYRRKLNLNILEAEQIIEQLSKGS